MKLSVSNSVFISALVIMCIMLAIKTNMMTEDVRQLKETFNHKVDSLTNVVIEHKPDRVFMNAYFVMQQHERIREHQLQLICKDVEVLKAHTNMPDWCTDMDADEVFEALKDTSLL